MKEIAYNLTIHAPWHCGSGLSAGADLDAVVLRDENRLPIVPGKTIKGLIREAAYTISALNDDKNRMNVIDKAFGIGADEALEKMGNNETECNIPYQGELFFMNCELPRTTQVQICASGLQDYLYIDRASTAINAEGIAENASLRKVEAVVPCTLEGRILQVNDEIYPLLCQALKYVKRLGQNRNRGWGRCDFIIKEEGGKL